MTLLTLAGLLLVVGTPGLAAVLRTRSDPREPAMRDGELVRTLALSYAGVGLAAIALWLVASAFGLSVWTAAIAPAAVAGVLVARPAIGPRAGRGERAPGGSASPAASQSRRVTPALAACSLASVVLVALPFAPYGWERTDGVHRMAMTDWEKHLVMTTGIAGSAGFPPPHPYIHADPAPSYYFGYHVVAAAIALVSHPRTDVFPALWLLTLLTAAATPIVVYVFARDLCEPTPALVAAAASTLLVGFDAVVLGIDTVRAAIAAWPLPGGFAGLRALIPSTHVDYWIHNLDRSFSAPIVTTMWAPHQTAATLIALLVMHLLAPRSDAPGRPRTGALLPALLIASLAALSTYIALALGAGVAACALVETWITRRAPWRTSIFRRWVGAGALGVLLALPVLPTVAHGSSSGLILRFSAAGTWTNGAFFSWLFGPAQWALLLDTPAVYFFEFGVIGVLGAVFLARRAGRLTAPQREAAVVAVAVVLLVTFVRPPVGVGNNLYARALLLVWFLLAPFAALAALEFRRSRVLAAAVGVCAAGTLYVQVGYLLEGTLFWATPKPAVEALRWVNDNTPRTALVAIRPGDYENIYGYWLRRPLVLGGRRLAVLFGADPDFYDRTAGALEAAFAERDAGSAHAQFETLEADVILVRRERALPPWTRGPCFAIAHENAEWMVIRREPAPCPPGAESVRAAPVPRRTGPPARASDRRRGG